MLSRPQCFLTVCLGVNHRKYQSSASLAFVREIHRWPLVSPHNWPVTRKCFQLMASSWLSIKYRPFRPSFNVLSPPMTISKPSMRCYSNVNDDFKSKTAFLWAPFYCSIIYGTWVYIITKSISRSNKKRYHRNVEAGQIALFSKASYW